ncbi:hypothetical protein D1B33_09810 [Lysinibacillus yapensis]|uniref:DUF4352 domain-containing protein n=1 Tax=Ureibacillus yapensis TaxID=2304605 RepID=A0A396SM64_9BACL|nr:hypothetical protein [Lysinibacillus yapensis]RHW36686.1 hypothetical protein D1B33_09810 [Lysinibacillus yapensis]
MKSSFKLLILGLLTTVFLAACGQDTKDVELNEESQQSEDLQKVDAAQPEEEKEESESKLGTRTNPVPFQKTASVNDELYDDQGNPYAIKFDLTITEVIRGDEAYQKLLSMNEFNEAAPEGYEWVLAKTKVKFVESETQDLSLVIDGIMNFDMVSESGDIYSGDVFGTTDPDFSFEMYAGNEKEGYIANLVKTGEKAQLRYEEMLGGNVFFNLQ